MRSGSLVQRAMILVTIVGLSAGCVTITPVAQVSTVATTAPTQPVAPTGNGTLPPTNTTPPTPRDSSRPTTGPQPTTTDASAAPLPTPTQTQPPTPRPDPTLDPNDPACSDAAFNLEGFHWNTVYRWRYDFDSTPAGIDPDAALAVIKTAFDNVVSERNDCGRPDTIKIFQQYLGKATRQPCTGGPDTQNVIGWGKIPADLSKDTIAYTCPYFEGGDFNIAMEADIVISDEDIWALSADQCLFQILLEPTITHEVGHVFGLDHVSEKDHPDLTMSTTIDGPCNDDQSTLGLGDMLGLESLYGAK